MGEGEKMISHPKLRRPPYIRTPRTREYCSVLYKGLDYDLSAWRLIFMGRGWAERFIFRALLLESESRRQKLRELVDPARRFPHVTWADEAFEFMRWKRWA